MASIKLLSPSLINQIAAGEVIERPASVAKELVENSIDAGSTEISVEIVSGGLEAIIIMDNGKGMLLPDARMAWERHATSKIAEASDLTAISSLGFRGEALASIASVAKCEMETKCLDEISGWKLKIEEGEIASEEEFGCPQGTKISVFNLFYNTPARRKYMKKESTEQKYITELIQQFAIANPGVAFRFVADGKVVIDTAPGTLEDRIADIFGSEVASNLVPVYYGGAGFKVDGFVGKPIISKSNRKGQFLVLNGRVIQNHLIAHAAREAFHSMLMHGKHPWFLLNLQVNLQDVDVNVHPRKLEVRFLKQNEVYKNIKKCVEAALDRNTLVGSLETENRSLKSENFEMDFREPRGIASHIKQVNREESFAIMQKGRTEGECQVPSTKLNAVAQIGSSYILAEDEEGLVIVDQHAAHERVMYEKLMKAMREAKVVSQPVLAPQNVDFPASEADILRENIEALAEIGFEVEEFGGNSFLVAAVPADLSGEDDPGEVLRGIVDDLANNRTTDSLSDKREHLINYAACRSAIKFGQKLSLPEMQGLLDQLSEIDRCETCPHGRPTMLRMTYDDLENRFKRKNF